MLRPSFPLVFLMTLLLTLLGDQQRVSAQQSAYALPLKIVSLTCQPIDAITKTQYNWIGENIKNFIEEELISLGFLTVPMNDMARADFRLVMKYTGRSIRQTAPEEHFSMTTHCELFDNRTGESVWNGRYDYDAEVYSGAKARVKSGSELDMKFSQKFFQEQSGHVVTYRVNDEYHVTRGKNTQIEFLTQVFDKFSSEFRLGIVFNFIDNLLIPQPSQIPKTFHSADSIYQRYAVKVGDTLIVKKRATDPEGDEITARIATQLPDGARFYTFGIVDSLSNVSRGGAVIIFTPDNNHAGKDYLIPFEFSDPWGKKTHYTVQINVLQDEKQKN